MGGTRDQPNAHSTGCDSTSVSPLQVVCCDAKYESAVILGIAERPF